GSDSRTAHRGRRRPVETCRPPSVRGASGGRPRRPPYPRCRAPVRSRICRRSPRRPEARWRSRRTRRHRQTLQGALDPPIHDIESPDDPQPSSIRTHRSREGDENCNCRLVPPIIAPMSSLRWLTRAAALAVSAAIAGVPMTARAQGAGEQAAAEALFKQGRDLMTAGRFAEACPKLAESERLDPATGTLLNLASCYERNGQLASAWVTYKEAASASQKAEQPERVQLARRKAAELEPRLPTLTIVVTLAADRPDLQIKRDGDPVGRAAWGAAIPVDPGAHAVDATAAGRKPWHGQASVEGQGTQTAIEVPALEVDLQPEPAPIAQSSIPAAEPARPDGATALPPASHGPTQRVLGVMVGVVGVAGVALGAVFGEMAKSDNNEASGHCLNDMACDPQALSLTSSARREATASTIGFVAGGALLAGGVVLFLTAPAHSPQSAGQPERRVGLSPLVGAGTTGVALRGAW